LKQAWADVFTKSEQERKSLLHGHGAAAPGSGVNSDALGHGVKVGFGSLEEGCSATNTAKQKTTTTIKIIRPGMLTRSFSGNFGASVWFSSNMVSS
jgi:hypothetical protein